MICRVGYPDGKHPPTGLARPPCESLSSARKGGSREDVRTSRTSLPVPGRRVREELFLTPEP